MANTDPAKERTLKQLADNFDHICPTFRDNRLEFYAYVHEQGCPVRRSESHGGFLYVTRYDTAQSIQRNPETFSNHRFTIPQRPVPPLIPATLDPPEHGAYKKLLTQFFTQNQAKAMEPAIIEMAERLIEKGIAAGKFDVVNDVMFPLMAEFTMSNLLGLNPEKAFEYAAPVHHMTQRDYPANKAAEELAWLEAQLTSDINEKRIAPEGVLGALTRADFEGRKLTTTELVLIAINLLIGGMGTTAFFMGSVVVFLGRNPAHRKTLIDEPAIIPDAIEELLRIYTPTQNFGRLVKHDTELEGKKLKAGDMVLVGYGAANFDPLIIKDPQVVDFRRKPNRQMSFGIGAHRCLGSHIAKSTACTVTAELLRRVPNYRLVEEEVIEQGPAASMFGFNTVPVMPAA